MRREGVRWLLLCCAALALLGLGSVLVSGELSRVPFRAPPEPHTAPAYCNLDRPRGGEGRGSAAMALRGVVLLVRHGDRSAVHTELNGSGASGAPPALRCDAARNEIERLNAAFVVRSLAGGGELRPLGSLSGERGGCAVGQLTPRGLAQHAALGRHLGFAYQVLFDGLSVNTTMLNDHALVRDLSILNEASSSGANASTERGASLPFHFRSTDYDRTLLSAASLLHAMLPPAMLPQPGERQARLPIWTMEDETRDDLQGVGLISSTSQLPSGGERQRIGRCAGAAAAARRQIETWREDPEAWRELERCNKRSALPKHSHRLATHVADPLYAYTCHGVPLPGCIANSLARRFWRASDRWYCERYSGSHGGSDASRLAMRPLLERMLHDLNLASIGKGPRLVLYSGHDTVIAPVLAALGSETPPVPCGWPPYASRIVWEVWTKNAARTADIDAGAMGGAGRQGPHGSDGGSFSPEDSRPQHNTSSGGNGKRWRGDGEPHIRVLYNGKVITHRILGCQGRRRHPHEAADLPRSAGEMCPLRFFEQALRRSTERLSCDARP